MSENLVPDISGLSYLPNFITANDAETLVERIYNPRWLSDLKRPVQHCGYKYGELKLISSNFQHNNGRLALCLPGFPSCHWLRHVS